MRRRQGSVKRARAYARDAGTRGVLYVAVSRSLPHRRKQSCCLTAGLTVKIRACSPSLCRQFDQTGDIRTTSATTCLPLRGTPDLTPGAIRVPARFRQLQENIQYRFRFETASAIKGSAQAIPPIRTVPELVAAPDDQPLDKHDQVRYRNNGAGIGAHLIIIGSVPQRVGANTDASVGKATTDCAGDSDELFSATASP